MNDRNPGRLRMPTAFQAKGRKGAYFLATEGLPAAGDFDLG